MENGKCCEWNNGYECKCSSCSDCPFWYELLDAGEVEWSLLDDMDSYDCLSAGYLGWD